MDRPGAAGLGGALFLLSGAALKATSFIGGHPSSRPAFETSVRAPSAVKGQTAITASLAKAGTTQPASSLIFSEAGKLCLGVLAATGAAAMRRRRRDTRSSSPVVCYLRSPALYKNRETVQRYLEPYGAIPGFCNKKLQLSRKVEPWRKRPKSTPSEYGRCLIEKQRMKFHYNIPEKQLRRRFAMKAFMQGNDYPMDRLMQMLESRLDNFLYRVGVAVSVPDARWMVTRGHVETRKFEKHGWKINIVPSFQIPLNCEVRVRDDPKSQELIRQRMADAGKTMQIPPHIEWDREGLTGKMLDVCDRHDFGVEINSRLVFRFWTGQRESLPRITHIYYPGTNKRVPKRAPHGGINPTPTNILNMKLGVGLGTHSRNRPPCLWGRKYPVNNPLLPDPRKMRW